MSSFGFDKLILTTDLSRLLLMLTPIGCTKRVSLIDLFIALRSSVLCCFVWLVSNCYIEQINLSVYLIENFLSFAFVLFRKGNMLLLQ
jgi:hypothetical protein